MPYVRRAARSALDRDLPALGTGRGAAGPAGRGGRRTRPGDDPDAPPLVRTTGRQDLDAWDPAASPIPKASQQALRTLEWIDRAGEPLRVRTERHGESHLFVALGHLAIDRGNTVAWHTLESLALRPHRAGGIPRGCSGGASSRHKHRPTLDSC